MRARILTLHILGAASMLLATACTTVGVRTGVEEPPYSRVAQFDDIEVRRYGERIAAQTLVRGTDEAARREGFDRLAGYIFGANGPGGHLAGQVAAAGPQSRTIAMTAPVAQDPAHDDIWRVAFFMPRIFRLSDLPEPHNPKVSLEVVPAQTFAVLRFSGARDAAAVRTHKARLLSQLSGAGWRAAGEPVAWFFDPPWTVPLMRRNEVAVQVEPKP